jgi:hypothetical protein
MACEVKYVHVRLLQVCEGVWEVRMNDRKPGPGRIEALLNATNFVLHVADAGPSTPRAALVQQ